MRLKPLCGGFLAGVVLLALAGPTLAQSSLGIGNAEMAMQPGGAAGSLFGWIAAMQRSFFGALREALVEIRRGGGGHAWLIGLSFVYGVFHAAGPGHGKAVISSYMLANEVVLRRGIVLSFVSALLQAVSAIVLVGAGWYVLRGTALSMTDAGYGLELASYAMIAAVGAWLLLAKLRRLWLARSPVALRSGTAGGGLAFAGPGSFSDAAPARSFGSAGGTPRFVADDCTDPRGDDCDCGRTHLVDPARLGGERLKARGALAAVLAVGLRPCSGAIVVLTFCLMNALYAPGILSVLAMALGTAITVSALAALAVFAKDIALRVGGGGRSWVRDGLELTGAGLLILIGIGLLGGALAQ